MRIPRAKIREYAINEWRVNNGRLGKLTFAVVAVAHEIVERECPAQWGENAPVGSVLAITLLFLQVIQVLTWLYSYWHQHPPSDEPSTAEVVAMQQAGYALHEDCFVPQPI